MKKNLIDFLKKFSTFPEWDIERIVDSILENEIDLGLGIWELEGKYSKDGHPHEFRF